jgi:polyhydroxyalkanoate synthesis regulator phasin
MADELEAVLRLVADGTLTPEQAAPIIEALSRSETPRSDRLTRRIDRGLERVRRRVERAYERAEQARTTAEQRGALHGRQLRIRVTEHGRQVVNLRIPIGFVDAALSFVPGIGGDQSERIRQAVAAGTVGPIIDVEDPDGDSVVISVE